MEKKTSYRGVNVNKLKAVNLYGSISKWFILEPATRSSHSEMFFKIGVLKSFAKFIGKQLKNSCCAQQFLFRVTLLI